MLPARPLRDHQRRILAIARAIAGGAEARDLLAAVTPGGGKSLLPVLMAHELIEAGIVERVCWVVPRDSLRLQAEEAFADPLWRQALGHRVSVRAAENAPDPCRGLQGYVTTYQGVAAAQYNLALLYDTGVPGQVEPDPEQAYPLFRAAARIRSPRR